MFCVVLVVLWTAYVFAEPFLGFRVALPSRAGKVGRY